MLKNILTAFLLCLPAAYCMAQVGIGTLTPDASAMLEIKAANKGLLVPRVSLTGNTDNATIPLPVTSLFIYNTASAGAGLTAVTPGFYYWNGSKWSPISTNTGSAAGAWSLTGNSGTTASNFIGTTDNKSLLFKIDNKNAGFLSTAGNTYWGLNSGNINSTGYSNVAIGTSTMPLCTTCAYNVAVGDSALRLQVNNPTGFYFNTALGSKTLEYNSTGSYNSASGAWALENNTTGLANTAHGALSMVLNATGNFNTAQGSYALFANQSGSNNVAMGYAALNTNSIGYSNIAIGVNSLSQNIDGHNLIAIGDSAMYSRTYSQKIVDVSMAIGSKAMYSMVSGYSNMAVGYEAMKLSTGGFSNTAIGGFTLFSNTSGNSSTAVGLGALQGNTTGFMNVAVGGSALYDNISGYHNTATGYQALQNNKIGNHNTAFGSASLYDTRSNDNTAVGFNSLAKNVTGYNNVAVGMVAMSQNVAGSNSVALGDSAMYNNLEGYNTATGSIAMFKNVDGYYNTANGFAAMYSNTSGVGNTAIGPITLQSNSTGSFNTVLGYDADVTSGNLTHATAIGADATVACSNCLVLGPINTNTFFTTTTKVDVGIGTNKPQTDLHVNPDGAGSILIGTNRSSGGYTNLEMGISGQSGGYSYIQATKAAGSAYGSLALNPSGGTVGIRINTALAPLHIKQSSDAYPVNGGGLRLERLANTNHWEIGTDAGDDLDFVFNGVAKAYINDGTGVYTTVSDRRFKKDISSLSVVLPAVMMLQAKTYHYTDNNAAASLSYGFIAQDVEKLFPDFVTTKGEDSVKAIAYQNFSVVAIKAIQEQQQIINSLQSEVGLLKEQMKAFLKDQSTTKLSTIQQ